LKRLRLSDEVLAQFPRRKRKLAQSLGSAAVALIVVVMSELLDELQRAFRVFAEGAVNRINDALVRSSSPTG
jgi:hypothetical protein